MSDIAYIILVLLIAFGVIFGVARIMDSRKISTSKTDSKTPLGPISRIVLWLSYGIIVMAALFIIGAFTLNQMALARLAGNFVYFYIFIGIIYRIIKPRGL